MKQMLVVGVERGWVDERECEKRPLALPKIPFPASASPAMLIPHAGSSCL